MTPSSTCINSVLSHGEILTTEPLAEPLLSLWGGGLAGMGWSRRVLEKGGRPGVQGGGLEKVVSKTGGEGDSPYGGFSPSRFSGSNIPRIRWVGGGGVRYGVRICS